MKFLKQALATASLAAGLIAGAQAAPTYTVGGVTWDAGSVIDFSANSVAIRQFIDGTTGVLSGFGTINTINGVSGFCAGCEVTFQYGGITPTGGAIPTPGVTNISYSGGWVKVYVDFSPEAVNSNSTTMTFASTGDEGGANALWLDLAGHNLLSGPNAGKSFFGTVAEAIDPVTGLPTGTISTLTGFGLMDVIGGLAASYFDTNTKSDGSDFSLTTSFTSIVNPLDAIGTGNFNSKSVGRIPEPASLALAGLAMIGVGVASRRSKKTSK